MSVAVVYWSQTGNTEAMANILAEAAGGEAINWEDFSADKCADYDAFAFGCPAMGAEELDPDFEELWDACKGKLAGKPVVLFGSYDWGTGEWLENWEGRCSEKGIQLAAESVKANNAPDDDALAACKKLGAAIA